MAKLIVEIETANAAFEPEEKREHLELARMLRKMADKLEREGLHHRDSGHLWDSNGNNCGGWDFARDCNPLTSSEKKELYRLSERDHEEATRPLTKTERAQLHHLQARRT